MKDTAALDLVGYAPITMRRDLAERLFPSREMADYLAGQKMRVETLIETINGAPVPLEEKREIFQSSGSFPGQRRWGIFGEFLISIRCSGNSG